MVIENVFLIILGLVWIIFAVVEDLKKREIANWLNFSLVIFALAFRFFFSLFGEEGFEFFYQGVIGFGIFLVIGNLLYYGKVFAGGDTKLMIALGAIIPLYSNFPSNLSLIFNFLIFFLVAGAFYGVAFGLVLGIKNKKLFAKEFSRQFKKRKKIFFIFIVLSIIFILLFFIDKLFIYLGILFFVSPYVYFFAKSIDESCMVKRVNPSELTEGDWLYNHVKVGRRLIEAKWSGLNKWEIGLLRKNKKKVLIRQGIPFSPVFLISYLALVFILIF
jgi:Flp pilus assembly protein protease CpaA